MRRPPFWSLALLAGTAFVASCLGPEATGVRDDGLAALAISPALIPSPADGSALPINRIRTTALRVSDGAVLGESVTDVSPTAPSWTLSLDVRLPTSTVDVTLTVLLINVASGGGESVEFSGVAGPLTLREGDGPVTPDVPIVRGPPANVFTTGITITSAPDTLAVNGTGTVSATASTSGTVTPTVFWTVLDTAVLSLSGTTLTGRALGTGRVVASAGAFTDTAAVVVATGTTPPQARVDVRVLKTVDQAQPLVGARIRFTVSATNLGPVAASNVAVFDTLRA
ncbi:MAG: hypothetical protein ABL963_15715, partial [Longimicrobiales bacterium]